MLVWILEIGLFRQEESAGGDGGATGNDCPVAFISHEAFGSPVILVGNKDFFFSCLNARFVRLDNQLSNRLPQMGGGAYFRALVFVACAFLDIYLDLRRAGLSFISDL